MKIKRVRFIVTRNNNSEILCGLARDFKFIPIAELKDTAIKTFSSKKKAESAFLRSWGNVSWPYNIIEVKETIEF